MGGRHDRNRFSTDEPREVTRAGVGTAAVDGDPFAAADSLSTLRRLAQESGKANPSRFQGRLARRHARQLRRREQRRASTRHAPRGQSTPSLDRSDHTAYWCPTVEVNILMPADRTCPACKQAI